MRSLFFSNFKYILQKLNNMFIFLQKKKTFIVFLLFNVFLKNKKFNIIFEFVFLYKMQFKVFIYTIISRCRYFFNFPLIFFWYFFLFFFILWYFLMWKLLFLFICIFNVFYTCLFCLATPVLIYFNVKKYWIRRNYFIYKFSQIIKKYFFVLQEETFFYFFFKNKQINSFLIYLCNTVFGFFIQNQNKVAGIDFLMFGTTCHQSCFFYI